jgi:hypothetical protein
LDEERRAPVLLVRRGFAARDEVRAEAALRPAVRFGPFAPAARGFAAFLVVALRLPRALFDDAAEVRRAVGFGAAVRRPARPAAGRPVFRFAIPPPRLP